MAVKGKAHDMGRGRQVVHCRASIFLACSLFKNIESMFKNQEI